VVEVLAQRGMQPVIATRAPLEKNFPWEWVEVDYLNKDSVDAAVETVDAVVHSAILNDFNVMQNNRRYAYDSYVVSTQNLSNAASDKPFVFISTDWVMDGTGHMVPEDEPPNPINIYGVLKAFGEMVVKDRKQFGMHCSAAPAAWREGQAAPEGTYQPPSHCRQQLRAAWAA